MTASMARSGAANTIAAVFVHQLRRTREIWRGVLVTGLASPTLFLLAIGAGLGSQIEAAELAELGVDSYMDFVGPGVLVATAMQISATESLWPTMGLLRWQGVYSAVLATPISSGELGVGHLLWIGFRAFVSATSFLVVLAIAGALSSVLAVLIIPVAVMVGWAHAGPLVSITVGLEQENLFPMLSRVVIFPLFLFSGAFFPVEDLPRAIALFAKVTPTWHGVELARHLARGELTAIDWLHGSYLVALSVIGFVLVHHHFRKQLNQ